MKYIRTKNNLVLKVSDKITDKYGTYYLYEDTKWFDFQIDKVADTIEELCDEFVVFGDIDRPYLTRHKFINKEWNKQYFIGGKKLYGAIWTDEGLIYVAKMNEKGELELL